MNDITKILQDSGVDEKLLAEQLLPLVYDELRHLAAAKMAREAANITLQPTALVHETWLRLTQDVGRTWHNKLHFYRAASLAMRRILIDHARQKSSLKRIGSWQNINIEGIELPSKSADESLLLIEDSLQQLEHDDPESAEIIMLKFFTGLTNKEAAELLGISLATIERRWAFAKVCLYQIISESPDPPTTAG